MSFTFSNLGRVDSIRGMTGVVSARTAASQFFRETAQSIYASDIESELYPTASSAEDVVIVVAVPSPGKVLLVRECGAGIDGNALRLPIGRLSVGESPVHAANRALLERTGYVARNLREVTELSITTRTLPHRAHVVLATDLLKNEGREEAHAMPELQRVSMGKLERMAERRELTETLSLAALFVARGELRLRAREAAPSRVRARAEPRGLWRLAFARM